MPNYKYAIGDRVVIPALDLEGHVIALFTGELGDQYYVAYFYNGELRKEYLFDFQLKLPSKGNAGFGGNNGVS